MIAVDIPMPKCCMSCAMAVWNRQHEKILSCQAMMAKVSAAVERGRKASGLTIEEYEQLRKLAFVQVDEQARIRPEGCPIVGEPVSMKMADGRTIFRRSELKKDRKDGRKSGNVVAFPEARDMKEGQE